MADDDSRDDGDALFGGEGRERRRAGEMREESDDLDELTERVSERLEEGESAAEKARQAADPAEEGGRPRIFSKDQLVEEAGVMARKMYGENRFSLDTETYGQRITDAGYYDLVDCWLIIAHRMDIKYHERFLRRASALPWGSRFNRRGIPNYYLFSMRGIDEAIEEHYLSPLISHKYKYLFTVRWLLPFGPPLAYFNAFSMSHKEAIEHAHLFEEGHGEQFRMQEQQELAYLKAEYDRAANRFERHKRKMEEWKDKAAAASDPEKEDAFKTRVKQELAEMEDAREEMEELYDEYMDAKNP